MNFAAKRDKNYGKKPCFAYGNLLNQLKSCSDQESYFPVLFKIDELFFRLRYKSIKYRMER